MQSNFLIRRGTLLRVGWLGGLNVSRSTSRNNPQQSLEKRVHFHPRTCPTTSVKMELSSHDCHQRSRDAPISCTATQHCRLRAALGSIIDLETARGAPSQQTQPFPWRWHQKPECIVRAAKKVLSPPSSSPPSPFVLASVSLDPTPSWPAPPAFLSRLWMVLFPPPPTCNNSGDSRPCFSSDVHAPPTARSRSAPANRPDPAPVAPPSAPCIMFLLGHPESDGSRLV